MTGGKTTAAQSYHGKPLTNLLLSTPSKLGLQVTLQLSFRDAPGGTRDPIPGHRRRALYTHFQPQPAGGTPPHQLSPALTTSHSPASPSPLPASPAAGTP